MEPNGGHPLVTRKLLHLLASRGHEIWVAAPAPSSTEFPGVSFEPASGWRRELRQVYNARSLDTVRSGLSQFEPDVVIVRAMLSHLSPSVLRVLTDYPSVYYAGNLEMVCLKGSKMLADGTECKHRAGVGCIARGCVSTTGGIVALSERVTLRRWKGAFDRVIANSRYVQTLLAAESYWPSVELLYNPIGPFGSSRRNSRPLVTFSGRLDWEKGADLLLEALPALVSAVPKLSVVIVGEGRERRNLQRLSAALGLAKVVRFTGWLDHEDGLRQTAGAWIHVVPSRFPEPFGNTAAEALARGIPVVATEVGGLPEFVLDGITGRLVPPANPNALSSALEDLLGDEPRLDRMAADGRLLARRLFSPDHYSQRLEQLLECAL